MRLSIPFGHKSHEPLGQVIQGSEVADAQPLPLENAKPLLHLVHPGTMHRHEVAHEAGMSSQPGLHLLSLMHLEACPSPGTCASWRWEAPAPAGRGRR